MSISLRARFALASGVLVWVAATAVAAAGFLALERSLTGQARRAAVDQAAQLAGQIDTGAAAEGGASGETGAQQGNYVDLSDPSLVGQLLRPGLWAAVLGPAGQAIRSSPGAPRPLAAGPLLDSCRRVGAAQASRPQPAAILACRRIGGSRRPLGFVVTATPLTGTDRTLRTTFRALALAVAAGGLGSFLLAWLLAARALRPLRLIARATRSIREGDPSRRIGYRGRDELGELAAELDGTFAELEGALRRQERFVADASHELKSPLAAARANVQLLRRWAAEEPGARAKALAALERSTARMARIVADLIQLAHGDDRLHYALEPVRVDDLLLEAQREAWALADGIDVVVERIEQAVVLGDRDRLQQLLANLIDNALRVTPATGVVRLALTTEQERVLLSVTDEGQGIPPEELPHVFDRFYRGRASASGSGSGLGLSIARAIARAHGGEIEVTSEPGLGSVFTVVLARQVSSDRHRRFTSASPRRGTVGDGNNTGGDG